MIIDCSIYGNEAYIFTGYQITKEEFQTLQNHLNFNDECDSIIGYLPNVLVGKILVRMDFRHEHMEWSNFSIDDIRDFSTNDSVRKVRFELMRLFPEKYTNEYPKLFIVTI